MLPRRNWTPYAKCSQNLVPATKPQQVRLASGLTRFAATPTPCVTVGPTNGITTNERHQEPSRLGMDAQTAFRTISGFVHRPRSQKALRADNVLQQNAGRTLACNERDLIERASETAYPIRNHGLLA